ncbi:surface-adhesin E family protein [Sphingosinithalassobacter portus]|uniref:surface-adhesin E family protein n=1 Tax=Stakelama portus TaxID=2676234 RepID=UPI000D6E6F73|nr:surface-adhesin E family protein [Sphingosinithalassobacter portus]
MKPYALLLIAIGSLAALPASAQQWQVAKSSGHAPDRAVYLVDTASITREGDHVRFRSMTVWEQPTSNGEIDYNRSVTDREANCPRHATAILTNSYYLNGQLTASEEFDGTIQAHEPGSVMRAVVDLVCGTGSYQTRPLGDPEPMVRSWLSRHP